MFQDILLYRFKKAVNGSFPHWAFINPRVDYFNIMKVWLSSYYIISWQSCLKPVDKALQHSHETTSLYILIRSVLRREQVSGGKSHRPAGEALAILKAASAGFFGREAALLAVSQSSRGAVRVQGTVLGSGADCGRNTARATNTVRRKQSVIECPFGLWTLYLNEISSSMKSTRNRIEYGELIREGIKPSTNV